MSSMDMEQRDYDSRTALHVAAAEGRNNGEMITTLTLSDSGHDVFVCGVFQDTLKWFASCWRPAKSIQFPETGNTRKLVHLTFRSFLSAFSLCRFIALAIL